MQYTIYTVYYTVLYIIYIYKIRVSLVSQDTWFSPRRPGFKSRTRKKLIIHSTVYIYKMRPWRNGSASDSRPEGWGFKSLWPHIYSILYKYKYSGLGLVGL